MEKKRIRTANYSQEEMELLLNLVNKFKTIIENKQTDHVTWLEKKETWEKIANFFNASSPSGVLRSAESLRKHYENKKSAVKKEVANEKVLLKTGGGKFVPKPDPLRDLTLSIMNETTVYGMCNQYDADSQLYTQFDANNNEGQEEITVIYETENISAHKMDDMALENESTLSEQMFKNNISSNTNILHSDLENSGENWKKYKPENLKRPLDAALLNKMNSCIKKKYVGNQNSITNVTASEKSNSVNNQKPATIVTPSVTASENLKSVNNQKPATIVTPSDKSWVSRRRPVAGVLQGLQSSHLAKKYSELAELKTQIA